MIIFKKVFIPTAILLLLACSKSTDSTTLKLMTFNIRLNLASDGVNTWTNRRELATSMIRFYEPEIFGVQEALVGQIHDLEEALPEYNWIGVGRDDGQEAGEFMAIYYLKDRFEVQDQATFWLSGTPEKPGLGWDAACMRVVTWVYFKDQKTGKRFYHFNTHLDHQGEIARQESARLLLSKIQAIVGGESVILTGDLNADPTSKPYGIITQGINGEGFKLMDSKQVSQNPHHGPNRTFNGFDLETLKTEAEPMDYIFVQNQIKVLKHATLSDTFDGFFPSDHMPVYVELNIE